jgi:putative tryptophan/tyrosine transport system substrate-binding protein
MTDSSDRNKAAAEGALMAYGPTLTLISRLVAEMIDRVLKGVSPAELPVLRPTKFELAINLKTAKALGLTVPPMGVLRTRSAGRPNSRN